MYINLCFPNIILKQDADTLDVTHFELPKIDKILPYGTDEKL